MAAVTAQIIDADPKQFTITPVSAEPTFEELTITEIEQKYPAVLKQSITSIPLVPEGRTDPVPGTVGNWIEHYESVLGVGEHGTMERGNFLFSSTNTKRLGSQDRHRVAVVLKALDENATLKIDPESQKLVFDGTSGEAARPQKSAKPALAPKLQTHKPVPQLKKRFEQRPPQQKQSALHSKASLADRVRDSQLVKEKSAQPRPAKPVAVPDLPVGGPRKLDTPPAGPRQAADETAPDTVAFSSKQKMPVEQRIQKKVAARKRSPYHMQPISKLGAAQQRIAPGQSTPDDDGPHSLSAAN